MNEPFNTDDYQEIRLEDGTLARDYGYGRIEGEISSETHRYNEQFHRNKMEGAIAQAEKVEAFELDNPLPEPEEQVDDTSTEV